LSVRAGGEIEAAQFRSMDQLHHELWIVKATNALLAPVVRPIAERLGYAWPANGQFIPDHIVMCLLIVAGLTVLCLFLRTRLRVEQPGKLQLLLEDVVTLLQGMLKENIGDKGPKYLPLVGAIGIFIFLANMIGKIPGFMSPTANLNVTLGCAVTVWVYYHLQGIRTQGILAYVKHFFLMPGVPVLMAPIMGFIEIISHLSRVMSLSLRLFGNIFGEEMIVIIIASIVPFIAPLPMMVLGVVTGTLQAYIFILLTMIYLAGAVHSEHDHEVHHAEAQAHAAL
jgi:F-type H+-transporting ATPase subunit a